MPTKQVSVEDLKKDQQKLKTELEKLENYFGKREQKKPLQKPPQTNQASPKAISEELLKQHIEANKKMLEKFDYLIDILLSSTEETKEEDLERMVYTLAQTQANALHVLSEVRTLVEKADQDMPSKKEIEQFESEQRGRYIELNEKVNMLIEKVERPPYLKELDTIRVGVLNILTELKRLEERGTKDEEIKSKVNELFDKVDEVHKSVKSTTTEQPSKTVEYVTEMTVKVDELEKSLKRLTKDKKEGRSLIKG